MHSSAARLYLAYWKARSSRLRRPVEVERHDIPAVSPCLGIDGTCTFHGFLP
jgi:hypothetical protein